MQHPLQHLRIPKIPEMAAAIALIRVKILAGSTFQTAVHAEGIHHEVIGFTRKTLGYPRFQLPQHAGKFGIARNHHQRRIAHPHTWAIQ